MTAESSIAPEPVVFPTARTQPFNPQDALRELQSGRPLCPVRFTNGEVGYLATSHHLAKRILTDSRFGRGPKKTGIGGRSVVGDPARMEEFETACAAYGEWRPHRGFIFQDPPAHSRIRRLLAPHFTMRRMSEFRLRIEQIVAEQLDALDQAGPASDLVSLFTTPVSLRSQCVLIGVPPDEAERFFHIASAFSDPAVSPADGVAAWREAWEYIRDLVKQKRQAPGDDVISDIVRHAELTDDEAADTATSIFQGGLEATGSTLGLSALMLLCHPDQLDALRADPALIENAVEELLRYTSVLPLATGETAFEDVDLDGTLIRQGETVVISLAQANRDPAKFPRPDELDLTRSTSGHLAFSQGIHMCLGQHLARLELNIGLTELLRRFPGLRLAVPAEDGYRVERGFLHLRELRVAW